MLLAMLIGEHAELRLLYAFSSLLDFKVCKHHVASFIKQNPQTLHDKFDLTFFHAFNSFSVLFLAIKILTNQNMSEKSLILRKTDRGSRVVTSIAHYQCPLSIHPLCRFTPRNVLHC